jgi:5-(carboxyamino)imidazole ribonucleotide mutase
VGDRKPNRVAIVMGSDSDLPTMEHATETLRELEIPHEVRILSAHRTPAAVQEFAAKLEAEGFGVVIAAAGMAAHLAGVMAAHTTLPVVGVPMPGGAFNGADALLSTVQMPGGIPVAAVSVGKSGAVNAAVLAAQILALGDRDIRARVRAHRRKLNEKVAAKDAQLRRRWPES